MLQGSTLLETRREWIIDYEWSEYKERFHCVKTRATQSRQRGLKQKVLVM